MGFTIIHRKYMLNCTEDEFVEFIKNTIGLSLFSYKEPYKRNIFKFFGEINLKKRSIKFHHKGDSRNSINPSGKIDYYLSNDSVCVDLNIYIPKYDFYIAIILLSFAIILTALTTNDFILTIVVNPVFFSILYFFLLLEFRFHRKLFLADFERSIQKSGVEFNTEEIYSNRYL